MTEHITLNLAGFQIGHATDEAFHTGCTVILCPANTVGSADVRGPAPGSRETALLAPDKPNHHVNAVLLTGGSAFGLAAADGVMRYLAERGLGHPTPIKPIPIVPTAVVFDLGFNWGQKHPDADMGYAACLAAGDGPSQQGNVGAGAGVTVGKWGGFEHMMKGGFGAASVALGDLVVGAMAVTNPVGDVLNADNSVLAGARGENGRWLADAHPLRYISEERMPQVGTNTTLVVVWTNARLTRPEAHRLAQRAHDGMATAVRPIHTTHDGDTAFALASGVVDAPFNQVANAGAEMVAEAIRNGVRFAASLPLAPGLLER
ncbi:MAG: P1 family peptidase [Chloroflexi bacterium]|nr:P1 family peptidase [Chloroflexota bacterium]MBK7177026.1 P1 family peptidase [Chloroflexota bacterium]